MTITIRRRLMEHDGGTKFYQLFHFNRTDDRPVSASGGIVRRTHVVTHWGAKSVAKPWPGPRPVNGGQVQHHHNTIAYAEKRAEKARERPGKGRYIDVGGEDVYTYSEWDEFELAVTELMGADEAHMVLVALSLRGPDKRLETARDLTSKPTKVPEEAPASPVKRRPRPPKAEPDTAISSPRPEGWGTW